MSPLPERTAAIFREGFSCSQAVLAAFAETYGLDRQTALKLGSCFGGGVQAAEICGAVSGAVMVVGLKDGYADPKNKEVKFFVQGRAAEFHRLFRERHKHLRCRDLLGCDITTPEGRRAALDGKMFTTQCPVFVASAVEILEQMGY